jgi:hypothetical protein
LRKVVGIRWRKQVLQPPAVLAPAAVAPFAFFVELLNDVREVSPGWAFPPFIHRIGSNALAGQGALAYFAIQIANDSLILRQRIAPRLLDSMLDPYQHNPTAYIFQPTLQPL